MLPFQPEVALLVNEQTHLAVLLPLEPVDTLTARIPERIAATLAQHGAPQAVIDEELRHMGEIRVGKTANPSVVAVMNDIARSAVEKLRGNP